MNLRAVGCLVAGVGSFLAIGLLGMWLAFGQLDGCPASFQWSERTYLAAGSPAAIPSFAEPGDPVELGSTFIGLTTRAVYGPPGSAPSASAADRPETIAVDCADGTFQSYAYSASLPTPAP
jgi:hypothetical protein